MSSIETALRAASAAHPIPGFVAAAAQGDAVIYRGAHGTSDAEAGAPMAPDAVFRIYSMTKAVTSTALMQLVERGVVALDDPASRYAGELADLKVLEGFAEDGTPKLRAARTPVTLRHLLTHSSGFGYDMWNADLGKYAAAVGAPPLGSGTVEALCAPLAFDPGEKWEYGISTDWVGQIVERVSGQTLEAYFAEHIFAPLGMTSSGFAPTDSMRARAPMLYHRTPDGALAPFAMPLLAPTGICSGGGGLLSTGDDYLRFLQMIANDGALGGARILKPETVDLMARCDPRTPAVRRLSTAAPFLTNDLDLWGDQEVGFSLGFLVNAKAGPDGRAPGSLAWAGLANSYYWVDRGRRLAGVFMTQLLPFADADALAVFGAFERAVCAQVNV